MTNHSMHTFHNRHGLRRLRTALFAGLLVAVQSIANAGASTQITEYPAPTARAVPLQVAIDSQSNVWFGEFHAGKLVRFVNGQMVSFGIAPASGPMNMWCNPVDDSIWFSALGDYIVRMSSSGQATTYPIPSANSMPMGTAGDSQGNIWFAEMFTSKIGVVRPNGHIDEYTVPTAASQPTGLTVDQYDNVWFAESAVDKIGVMRKSGVFNEYDLPTGSKPMGVNYSPMQMEQNVIWFTASSGNQIGSITQNGVITLYAVPTASSTPQMVMEDMVGNVWFSEMSANKIGRLRANRTFSEYAIPTANSKPMGLAIDMNNGSIWFVETLGNNLGHLVPID